jgi:hypothetical protein
MTPAVIMPSWEKKMLPSPSLRKPLTKVSKWMT